MSKFLLSAFADECVDSTEGQLRALRMHGIDKIEIRHLNRKNISLLSREDVEETKRMLDRFEIGVSAIGSPIGKIRLDEDMDAHMEMAERVFEWARRLETQHVRIFSFYAPHNGCITEMREEVLSALERLVLLARRYGVTLCHENEAKIYGDVPARCRELLDHFKGELGCVFDMGNFVLEGVDPYPHAYGLLQKYITYFHIKDALATGAIVPPGMGDAKIKEILTAHSQYADADFTVSLEPHLQVFSGLKELAKRDFENPFRYPDAEAAFADAVTKFKEMMSE